MDQLIDILFSFPTAILSVLLGLVLLYWGLVLVGALDLDFLDLDADLPEDATGHDGLFSVLGMTGVPATVAASVLVLWSWLLTALGTELLKVFVGGGAWYAVLALLVLVGSLVIGVLISALFLRPLQHFFKTPEARHVDTLVGKICVVRTQRVDEDFGQADFADGGAGLLIQVRARPGNGLSRDDKVLIIERDKDKDAFWVRAFDDGGGGGRR